MITLKTLAQATEQEVFNQACEHLIRQGKKSTRVNYLGEWICAYEDDDGLKCAVGCFFGDGELEEDFEGMSWNSLVTNALVSSEHLNIMRKLQSVHDSSVVVKWPNQLKKIAEGNDLTIPEILKNE